MLKPFLVIVGCLIAIPLAARFYGWCYRKLIQRWLRKKTRGSLVLTYDDGPDVPLTSQLAELLESQGVLATFFLLGARAETFPDTCQLLMERSHELGSHSYRHLNAWKVPAWSAIGDFRAGVRSLSNWLDPNACFRPPHGKLTFFTWLAFKLMGIKTVDWTIDSGDTAAQLPDPQTVVQRVVDDDGGVVLLHCHHTVQERIEYVLTLTEALIQEARSRNWQVRTVRDLFDSAAPSRKDALAGST